MTAGFVNEWVETAGSTSLHYLGFANPPVCGDQKTVKVSTVIGRFLPLAVYTAREFHGTAGWTQCMQPGRGNDWNVLYSGFWFWKFEFWRKNRDFGCFRNWIIDEREWNISYFVFVVMISDVLNTTRKWEIYWCDYASKSKFNSYIHLGNTTKSQKTFR